MINISKNKCVGCGTCVIACPKGIKIINGIAVIKDRNADCLKNAVIACPQNAIKDIKQDLIIAIGTDDNKTIKQNDHVGMSKFFQIWKYSNGNLDFREKKENIEYQEDESKIHGDSNKAQKVSSVLDGVDVIVGKIIGPNIVRMKKKFVPVIIREPLIEIAVKIIKENINEIIDEKKKEERMGIILK